MARGQRFASKFGWRVNCSISEMRDRVRRLEVLAMTRLSENEIEEIRGLAGQGQTATQIA